MNRVLPKIFLSLWVIWFVSQVLVYIIEIPWGKLPSGAYAYGMTLGISFGGPLLIGLAGWLGWELYQQHRLNTAVWFIVLCLILIWKYWIGGILGFMLPVMGSHTFGEAVSIWWSRSIARVSVALGSFLPPLLLLVSVFYWPGYCRRRKMESQDHSS